MINYIIAATKGKTKATTIYRYSFDYKEEFRTMDAYTEYMIRDVQIIDDKSNATLMIDSKIQNGLVEANCC